MVTYQRNEYYINYLCFNVFYSWNQFFTSHSWVDCLISVVHRRSHGNQLWPQRRDHSDSDQWREVRWWLNVTWYYSEDNYFRKPVHFLLLVCYRLWWSEDDVQKKLEIGMRRAYYTPTLHYTYCIILYTCSVVVILPLYACSDVI